MCLRQATYIYPPFTPKQTFLYTKGELLQVKLMPFYRRYSPSPFQIRVRLLLLLAKIYQILKSEHYGTLLRYGRVLNNSRLVFPHIIAPSASLPPSPDRLLNLKDINLHKMQSQGREITALLTKPTG